MARFSLLLLALVASASAIVHDSRPGSLAPPRAAPMRLRGGLGDIDPLLVAKGALGMGSINAALMALSPSKAGKMFSVQRTGLSEWFVEGIGGIGVGLALLCYLSLNGMAIGKAAAWSIVPNLVFLAKSLLNDYPSKNEMSPVGPWLNVLIQICFGYAFYSQTGSTLANITNSYAAWAIVNGIYFFLDPAGGLKTWGFTGSVTETDKAMMKNFGYTCFSFCAALLALAQGESAVRAVGFSYIPGLVSILDGLFVSQTAQKLGVNMALQYLRLAMHSIFIAGTLF